MTLSDGNLKILIFDEADEVIEELFESLLHISRQSYLKKIFGSGMTKLIIPNEKIVELI